MRNISYLCQKWAAFAVELSLLSSFFDQTTTPIWQTPNANLSKQTQAGLFSLVAFRLRALGRFKEAVSPMQTSLKMQIDQKHWEEAGINANNLSVFHLILGNTKKAIEVANQAIVLAKKNKDDHFWAITNQTLLADAQHQAGYFDLSLGNFIKTEKLLQHQNSSANLQLSALQNFRYCDLLLENKSLFVKVQKRTNKDLKAGRKKKKLLTIAVDQLILSHTKLQKNIHYLFKNEPLFAQQIKKVTTKVNFNYSLKLRNIQNLF